MVSTLDDEGVIDTDLAERHRIRRALRHELERHPAVVGVRGVPDGRFRELRATMDPDAFGREANDATLRVAWWPAPDDPEFLSHCSESSGFDCGYQRGANSHVSGKTHYQERSDAEAAYDYEAVSFGTRTPTRLCWAILDRLADRLG